VEDQKIVMLVHRGGVSEISLSDVICSTVRLNWCNEHLNYLIVQCKNKVEEFIFDMTNSEQISWFLDKVRAYKQER